MCTVELLQLREWTHRKSAYAQLSPFYLLSTLHVTHVINYSRPSPAFPYCKRWKAGRGLENTIILSSFLVDDPRVKLRGWLTYPVPRSSLIKGYLSISWRPNSSHRALPGLGPNLATSRVTNVRTMSLRLLSSRTPASMQSWVSCLQYSGMWILSEEVVDILDIEPSRLEIGEIRWKRWCWTRERDGCLKPDAGETKGASVSA